MKLRIKRSIDIVNPFSPRRDSWAVPEQERVYYVISYYIEFSPEELETIKKYHLEEHPIMYGADGKPLLRVKDYLECQRVPQTLTARPCPRIWQRGYAVGCGGPGQVSRAKRRCMTELSASVPESLANPYPHLADSV
jgi:hypothetical protein